MTKELENLDHVTDGEKNFLSQYQLSPIFKSFVKSFTEELNELETQFGLFLTETGLRTANGEQLNGIGRILNAKTRPQPDELFRILLNALAAAYNSDATAQDIRALLMIAVDAEDVFIDEDPGGGVFSVTIFGPDFIFGQDVVFDVVNLAKAAGVEFQSFIISDSFSDPTFSFVGDNRPNSEGFAVAVPIQVPDTFYLGYAFAPSGSVTITDRVWLTSSSGDPKEDLTVNFVTSNANMVWYGDLLLNFAVVGGKIEWANNDSAKRKFRLNVIDATDVYEMTVIGNYQHHEFRIVTGGVKKSVIQIDSSTATEEILNAEFIPYVDIDAAAWALNNPSGIGKTFVEDSSGFPEIYATAYGGRYSVLIS